MAMLGGDIRPRKWTVSTLNILAIATTRQGVWKMKSPEDVEFSPEETARRRDEAIRRALNTPPTPQKEMVGKVGAPNRGRPKRGSRPLDKAKDQA